MKKDNSAKNQDTKKSMSILSPMELIENALAKEIKNLKKFNKKLDKKYGDFVK